MSTIAERAKGAITQATKKGTLAGLAQSQVHDVIAQYKGQIAQALPKHLTADRIIQVATTLVKRNPLVAECSAQSIIGAIMQASILGLEPVEALGECYFVPYSGQVQFQIGYKGFLQLARRSGQIQMVYAEVVRKGDEFDYELGLHPTLKHKPTLNAQGDMLFVYAVVHYKDGGYNFVILTKADVEKYRLRSPMQKSGVKGAWATDYEAMAKKTAIRRLSTYLPISVESINNATATDEKVLGIDSFAMDGSGTLTGDMEDIVEVEVVQDTLPPAPKSLSAQEQPPVYDNEDGMFNQPSLARSKK
jgi:recombination protein RecT